MSDIKIFVSHRIELDSETIENPLYYPVRCGAVDDHRENVAIPGDNTGEHISEKRVSFGEFTIQYWAWKNAKADYYGLCHYRRYLSFAPKDFHVTEWNHVVEPSLDRFSINRHWLLNESYMRKLIEAHDIIVGPGTDIRRVKIGGKTQATVYEHWAARDGVLIDKKVLDILIDLIVERHPEYLQSARQYFAGHEFRMCNAYILNRDLFYQLCEFQFDILFELERRLDLMSYNNNLTRMPSYMGEIMYGIFIHHLQMQQKYRMKELPLIFFAKTEKTKSVIQSLTRRCFFQFEIMSSFFNSKNIVSRSAR